VQPLELINGQEPAQARTYKLCVHTGKGKGAGTTSNVSLSLLGPNIQCFGPVPLELGRSTFQRGAVDEFEIAAPTAAHNVAPIENVQVDIDGSGASPEWFLEKIVVVSDGLGESEFLCHDWLGPSNLSRRLARNAPAEAVVRRMYQITVHTGGAHVCVSLSMDTSALITDRIFVLSWSQTSANSKTGLAAT
jgi:hypothetical protein